MLSNKFEFGLHPSYASNNSLGILKEEKELLEDSSERSISISRQHFLKLNFPKTYNSLLEAGIKEDFTLGFHDTIGFRTGTCTPFYFYQLETEQKSTLKIYPLNIMDVTLKNYSKYTPDEAIEESMKMITSIKQYGGVFTLLWHNSSFCKYYGWEGWKKVFEEIVKEANVQH